MNAVGRLIETFDSILLHQEMEEKGIRFLSFSNDKEDAEKEATLREAALRIEQAIAKEKTSGELVDYNEPVQQESADLASDTRPLYERLLEQRNKKKEAAVESQKLSNLITTLDEEDVNYLNEVARNKREEELKKRLEVFDLMEEKKRLSERRIDDEEKKKKESLLGKEPSTSSKNSFLKSRITVKVKPKFVSEVELQPNPRSKIESSSTSAKPKRLDSEVSTRPKEQQTCKRQKTTEIPITAKEHNLCSCNTMDTMLCIGVLPSLPTIEKLPDSSESDYSDDDLDRRLVPRVGERRRR